MELSRSEILVDLSTVEPSGTVVAVVRLWLCGFVGSFCLTTTLAGGSLIKYDTSLSVRPLSDNRV